MAEFHEDDADHGDEEQKDGPADEGDADGLGGGPGAGSFIPGAVVLGRQGVHVAHDADEEGHEVEGREAAAHGPGEEKLAQFGEEEAVHEEVDGFRGLAHHHGQGDNADVLEPGPGVVGVLPGGRIRGGRIPGGRGIGKRDGFCGGCVAHDDEDYSPLSIHGEAPDFSFYFLHQGSDVLIGDFQVAVKTGVVGIPEGIIRFDGFGGFHRCFDDRTEIGVRTPGNRGKRGTEG